MYSLCRAVADQRFSLQDNCMPSLLAIMSSRHGSNLFFLLFADFTQRQAHDFSLQGDCMSVRAFSKTQARRFILLQKSSRIELLFDCACIDEASRIS